MGKGFASQSREALKLSEPQLEFKGPCLVMVAGLPGCGKSYLLERLKVPAYSPDNQLDNNLEGESKQTQIREIIIKMLEDSEQDFAKGRSVVIDLPALDGHIRRAFTRKAKLHGLPAHLILLRASLEECLEGQRQRGRELPPEVMSRYQTLQTGLEKELDSDPEFFKKVENFSSVTLLDRPLATRLQALVIN